MAREPKHGLVDEPRVEKATYEVSLVVPVARLEAALIAQDDAELRAAAHSTVKAYKNAESAIIAAEHEFCKRQVMESVTEQRAALAGYLNVFRLVRDARGYA